MTGFVQHFQLTENNNNFLKNLIIQFTVESVLLHLGHLSPFVLTLFWY